MSDIVDNVMNAVNGDAESVEEVVVNEEVEVAPEPTHEPTPEPAPEPEPEPVTTQEVVQNIHGILSSTDNKLLVDNSELEERVKSLEEKLDKLITLFKSRKGLNDLQRGRYDI